jgi:hypothetical protein
MTAGSGGPEDGTFRTGSLAAASPDTSRLLRGRPQGSARQYVDGRSWRTSRTKILDNALIGFCRRLSCRTNSTNRRLT